MSTTLGSNTSTTILVATRVTDDKNREIEDLQRQLGIWSKAQFVRELIDVGLANLNLRRAVRHGKRETAAAE